MSKYNSTGNCVFNISYHIVWIPKHRKHIINSTIEIRLKEIILKKATQIGIIIAAIECMPDHIHIFVKSRPSIDVSYIVKMLKGYSSYILRKEFIHLKKYKALWTPSYFCESIGYISENTIIQYINNQKNATKN